MFVCVCSDSGLCLILLQLLIFTPVFFAETFHSFVFPPAFGLKRRQIRKQNPFDTPASQLFSKWSRQKKNLYKKCSQALWKHEFDKTVLLQEIYMCFPSLSVSNWGCSTEIYLERCTLYLLMCASAKSSDKSVLQAVNQLPLRDQIKVWALDLHALQFNVSHSHWGQFFCGNTVENSGSHTHFIKPLFFLFFLPWASVTHGWVSSGKLSEHVGSVWQVSSQIEATLIRLTHWTYVNTVELEIYIPKTSHTCRWRHVKWIGNWIQQDNQNLNLCCH